MPPERQLALVALIAIGCQQNDIDLGSGLTEGSDTASMPSGSGTESSGGEPLPSCDTLDPSAVVFINFDGAEIVVGPTDATQNTTQADDLEGTYPPYGGDGTKRDAVFELVRAAYAPFNIAVVDQRPAGSYGMVMVGPTPKLIADNSRGQLWCAAGFPPKALAFVQAAADDGVPAPATAGLIARAAAWGLGLESAEPGHDDVMSDAAAVEFTNACIPTRDQAMCMFSHEEACGDPQMQNSFVELMEHWDPCPA